MCLMGCSIGEFGTFAGYTALGIASSPSSLFLVSLPIVNGLVTSVALESFILHRKEGLPMKKAVETAMGMSFVSMLAMEGGMEAADFWLTGSLGFEFWAMPGMLLAGFVVPLPYNYFRIKKYGKSCH